MFKMKKLKKGQLYSMWLSGYREYFSFGDNLEVMAQNLLERYNWFCEECDKVKSLSDMANDVALEMGYHFDVYIVEINIALDDEYRAAKNEIYLGDYLEYVRIKEEE